MDLDQMAYRCPKAEVVETVRLEGYRLTFAAAGSGLATIFPEEGSHVDGVLWSLTGTAKRAWIFMKAILIFTTNRKSPSRIKAEERSKPLSIS